jgi:hypothetical protein
MSPSFHAWITTRQPITAISAGCVGSNPAMHRNRCCRPHIYGPGGAKLGDIYEGFALLTHRIGQPGALLTYHEHTLLGVVKGFDRDRAGHIGRLAAAAQAPKATGSGWWWMCWYLSVTMAPRRFHRLRPTICTSLTKNALAVRTIEPILKSCSRFSMAICNGCRELSRSATIASRLQYRYLSMTLRRSPIAKSSRSQ